MARDHEQPLDAREARDDVLDHPIGEIVLRRIAAHVLKRQHRDGRLFGQRERGSLLGDEGFGDKGGGVL